jgi:hypothetical protein
MSLVLLFIYAQNKTFGLIAITLGMIGGFISSLVVSFENGFVPIVSFTSLAGGLGPNRNMQLEYYSKPWTRCPPYFVV